MHFVCGTYNSPLNKKKNNLGTALLSQSSLCLVVSNCMSGSFSLSSSLKPYLSSEIGKDCSFAELMISHYEK